MSSDDQTNYFKKFNSTTWIDSVNQSKFFNSFEIRFSFFEIDSFWLNSLSFFFQNSCLSLEHFFFHFNETFFTKNRHQNNFIRWYYNRHEICQNFTSKHEKKNVSKKKSEKSKNITTNDANLSFIKLNKIFRFLFDELRSVIFIEKKYIRLSVFLFVSSKTQSSFFFLACR